MNKTLPCFGLIAAVLSLTASSKAHAGCEWDVLAPAQQQKLRDGSQVVLTRRHSGEFYPEVWVYQLVDATPEEALAVYYDYERHKDYMPYVTAAAIEEGRGRADSVVDWTVKVPVLGIKHSLYRHHIEASNGDYRMHWESIQPPVGFKSEISDMAFEPALPGATLIVYYTTAVTDWWTPLMYPTPSFVSAYTKTEGALVKQVEMEKREQSALLDSQTQALRNALAYP
jgi:hypothetical protein